jgi:riboflavin kinase / FMN adenylyltransferase
MKIFRSPTDIPGGFGPSVVTIGNFDGLHIGHRQIMRRVVALANMRGAVPVVLTFDPHPARVLAPERAPKLLMTIDQRLRNMEEEGIEAVLLLPFSLDFARLTPEEFANEILARTLSARVVLVGDDFRFGYKQAGSVDTLRELGERLGFGVEAVSGIARRGERVSSSGIRKLVGAGAVSRACRMLGAPFALEGNVVRGQGIGSKQTVPTLNLEPLNEVLPKTGVYVTRTRALSLPGGRGSETPDTIPGRDRKGATWNSITNVGYRPTFEGENLTVETFLLDPFDGETPGKIEVSFLLFVRDERKFETPEALKAQIFRDVGVAQRLHRRLAKSCMG